MDELVTQGQWWWLLPVPLLTFVFAVAGSWWGSRLGRTTEHWQWLRNEKQKEYVAALDTIEDVLEHLSGVIENRPLTTDFRNYEATFLTPLKILGSTSVTDSLSDAAKALATCVETLGDGDDEELRERARPHLEFAREEKNRLISLMRADLKVR